MYSFHETLRVPPLYLLFRVFFSAEAIRTVGKWQPLQYSGKTHHAMCVARWTKGDMMRKRLLFIGLLVVGIALLSGCELLDRIIDEISGGGTPGNGTVGGLAGWWKFDESAGQILDSSGNGNHGVSSGSVTHIPSGAGSALKLPGVSDPSYVRVPYSSSLQLSNKVSVCTWLRVDSSYGQTGWDFSGDVIDAAIQTVFAKRGDRKGFYLNVVAKTATSQLGLYFGINPYDVPSAVLSQNVPYTLGTWIHVATVADVNELRIYVNGEVIATLPDAVIDFSRANSEPLYFGIQDNDSPSAVLRYWFPLNGALDDFRWYNRVLSGAEIRSFYQAGR